MLTELKMELADYKKIIESILYEQHNEHNSLCKNVTNSGIEIYNKMARKFNSLNYEFKMHFFREDTSPNLVTHPKAIEILGQVETALHILERENMDENVNKLNMGRELTETVRHKKIFISHSYKDIEYVRVIVELLEDLGLRNEKIFCSSMPEYGIPNGKDIYDYLREQFNSIDLTVLFILSNRYYNSPVCLNEMGASWVLKKESLSILLPDFGFEDMNGVVNKNAIAIKIDEDNSQIIPRLNELKELIENSFNLEKLSISVWERKRDQFLSKISKLIKSQQSNDRVYKRKIVKVDRVGVHTFYLLDEKLPLCEIDAKCYVDQETHWLADWKSKNDTLLMGKAEIEFRVEKVDKVSDYIHNGKPIKNARSITAQIIS